MDSMLGTCKAECPGLWTMQGAADQKSRGDMGDLKARVCELDVKWQVLSLTGDW